MNKKSTRDIQTNQKAQRGQRKEDFRYKEQKQRGSEDQNREQNKIYSRVREKVPDPNEPKTLSFFYDMTGLIRLK